MRYCLTPAACRGDDRIKELEAALTRIVEWVGAYQVETLSSHSALRHCVTGVRNIATVILEELR